MEGASTGPCRDHLGSAPRPATGPAIGRLNVYQLTALVVGVLGVAATIGAAAGWFSPGDAVTAESEVNRGVELFSVREDSAAIEAFDSAIALDPSYAAPHVEKGELLLLIGDDDGAETALERALVLEPDGVRSLLDIGHARIGLAKYPQALASFDRVLSLEPSSGEAWLGRGQALLALSRPGATEAYQNGLEFGIDRSRFSALLDYAEASNALNDYSGALDAFDDAIKLQSAQVGFEEADGLRLYEGRAHALHNLGRFDDALAAYEEALSIDPDNEEVLRNVGNTLNRLERPDEGLLALLRAEELFPGRPVTNLFIADSYERLGQDAETESHYRKAIELNKNPNGYRDAQIGLLTLLERTDAPIAEIQEAYSEALEAIPGDPTILVGAGSLVARLGAYEESIGFFDAAIQSDPSAIDAYAKKSASLWLLGRPEDALEAVDAGLEVDRDNSALIELRHIYENETSP